MIIYIPWYGLEEIKIVLKLKNKTKGGTKNLKRVIKKKQ